MKTLIYTGGEIKGFEAEVGEKFRFISQEEQKYLGMSVKLNNLISIDTHRTVYVTANELTECFEVIS